MEGRYLVRAYPFVDTGEATCVYVHVSTDLAGWAEEFCGFVDSQDFTFIESNILWPILVFWDESGIPECVLDRLGWGFVCDAPPDFTGLGGEEYEARVRFYWNGITFRFTHRDTLLEWETAVITEQCDVWPRRNGDGPRGQSRRN
jgi:hypothetical protein